MESLQATKAVVEAAIRSAFADVELGRGISIRQSEAMDRPAGMHAKDFDALPRGEVTDDWTRIPDEELDRICMGYLNPEGFRYYIPALILAILRHYDGNSLRDIGTLSSLYPKQENRDFLVEMYSLLNLRQKAALAYFLRHLPEMVPLVHEHPKQVSRALSNYWQAFLDPPG